MIELDSHAFVAHRRFTIVVEARRSILVVEDDPETARQLAESLTTNGYQVDLAATGGEALRRGRSAEYTVMTIDRMLPDIDGIAFMQQLRDDGIAAPVLIVSALGEIDDLARRSATLVKETVLRVGDLEMDLVARTVSRRGREIKLLPREFQLLEYLVRNEDRVVSRSMLLQHVWDIHFDPATNIIDVYVGRVRRKVDGQQAYPLIHTVRGVGYCVRAPR